MLVMSTSRLSANSLSSLATSSTGNSGSTTLSSTSVNNSLSPKGSTSSTSMPSQQQSSTNETAVSRKWRGLSARLGKTLLAFGFYLGNLLLNVLLLAIIHERTPLNDLPIPDVTFDLLPYWPQAIYIVECYVITLLVLVFLLVIFHRNGYRIGQRFCLINGIVYFTRAISIAVTQLPVSSNKADCEPKIENLANIWLFMETIIWRCLVYVPTLGFSLVGGAETTTYCGDNLFSGYMVSIVIGYCFLSYYLMPAEVKATSVWWWAVDGLLYSCSIISVLLMMLSRAHYLVDILFGYYVSTRVFYIYHTICNHESLHYSTAGNFFTKFWWWPLFVFFEVDNPGKIFAVNRFYNPFAVVEQLVVDSLSRFSNSNNGRNVAQATDDKISLSDISN